MPGKQPKSPCNNLCKYVELNKVPTCAGCGRTYNDLSNWFDMNKEEKERSHELFINGEIMTIVATISFGMGIDKGDIRHVVNFGPPANIETYYQEIGRAGRDGIVSKATIYYDDNDFATTAYLIDQTEDEEQKKIKFIFS